jgi:hypothetical protein
MAITKEVIIDVNSNIKDTTKDVNDFVKQLDSAETNIDKLKVAGEKSFGALDKVTGGYLGKARELFTSIKEMAVSFNLAGLAKQAYAKIVGTTTGALKALRIALASTGIGLLVVGVGLLVANFEKVSKWVTDLIEKFGGWRNVLMLVAPPIYGIIKALEFLGIIDDEQTVKAKKNAEERIKSLKAESAELDKKRKKTEDYYDFEIAKAKAAGKNTEEIEKQKRKALLQTLDAQNKLEESWIRTSKATQEDIKRWNERQRQITNLLREIEIAEIQANKQQEDRTKANFERQKQEAINQKKAILDIENNFKRQIEDLEDKTEDERLARAKARALQQVNEMKGSEADKQKARLEIIAFYGAKELELEDKKQKEKEDLEQKRQEQILAIQQSFSQKLEDLEDVTELQKIERQQERELLKLEELGASEQQKLELLMFYESQKTSVIAKENKEREQLELEVEQRLLDAKKNALNEGLNILSQFAGKNKALAKGIIAIQKGLAIADVVISTQKEIAGIASNPFLTALPDLGLAIKTKAILAAKIRAGVNIASIAAAGLGSKQPSGGAGGGTSVNVEAPQQQAPQFNTIGTSGINQLAQTFGQQQPIQTYVVSTEVTSAQSLQRNIVQNATL